MPAPNLFSTTGGSGGLMLWISVVEATIALILLIPCNFIVYGPVRLVKWLHTGSPRQFTFGFLLFAFILVGSNLFGAIKRFANFSVFWLSIIREDNHKERQTLES